MTVLGTGRLGLGIVACTLGLEAGVDEYHSGLKKSSVLSCTTEGFARQTNFSLSLAAFTVVIEAPVVDWVGW